MPVNLKIKLPLGYKANGLACGIKKSGKPDLGLIYSEKPARASGLFTSNKITSGSVRFCQENLKESREFRAIIINSGNANCLTKDNSFTSAGEVASNLAYWIKIRRKEILFASTGIIGRPLPVKRIKKAMPILVDGLSKSRITKVTEAMRTTDTFIKQISVRLNIGRKAVTICGLAKGAGMIAPNLTYPRATMLCFILSDADVAEGALRKALIKAVENSFNCITIDGCMSTNDTVLMMSNAAAGNIRIKEGSRDFKKFSSGLSRVCINLAKMIVRDAEGASKFIQIKVKGSRTYQEAKRVALSIANSNLFKTAMYGGSNNFGRIFAAIGASGVDVKAKDISLSVSPLRKKDIFVEVGLKRGYCEATIYTSDLTPEYVKINAAYN